MTIEFDELLSQIDNDLQTTPPPKKKQNKTKQNNPPPQKKTQFNITMLAE